jgi:hypothetical protein
MVPKGKLKGINASLLIPYDLFAHIKLILNRSNLRVTSGQRNALRPEFQCIYYRDRGRCGQIR